MNVVFTATPLNFGTTYYWKVVSRTFANMLNPSGVVSFSTPAGGTQPPTAPANPSPASGTSGVGTNPTLTWSSAGATSYAINFGTTNPPPSTGTSTGTPSYTPGTLASNTTYFWQIIASNSIGSTPGPIWSLTTSSSNLPSPWQSQDVGAVGATGSSNFSGGVFTLRGAGADIWGSADAFQFGYQTLTGDGQIVARLATIQNTAPLAKAGVMLRSSVAANSAHVILDVRPTGDIEFMTRSTAGGSTSWLSGATQTAPVWLKLARAGSAVTGYISTDGATWTQVGTTTITFPSTIDAGLIVNSHDTSTLNTSTFDSVAVTAGGGGGGTPPAAPASPSPANTATGVSITPSLTWTASGATSYDVKFGTVNPPPQVSTGQAAASYSPGTLANSHTYFWQIVANNATGSTPGPIWSFTTGAAAVTDNIVIYASDIAPGGFHGSWSTTGDATAAAGVKATTPDLGVANTAGPLASPTDFVDVSFDAPAGTPYTFWLRLKATGNSKFNDAVFVQFSDARSGGSPIYQMNTTSGLAVNLATDSTGSSLNNWGWGNSAYWLSQPTTLTFASSGTHTLRIQVREDGVQFDQIVLSPSQFLSAAPGGASNDSTIVPKPAPPAAPAAPGSPGPANGASGVAGSPTLTWTAAGATSYDVAFGTANPPPTVSGGQVAASYATSGPSASTTYFWQIVARNSSGATPGPVWSFTTAAPPPPPGTPGSPSPADGATGVSTTPTLTWSATSATSYDVRFGPSNPPPQVSTAQSSASFSPSALSAGTTYFWQIVANNSSGSAAGPIWSFTTAAAVGPANIVIYASDIPSGNLHGSWSSVADATAAASTTLSTPDAGVANTAGPLASPTDYVDVSFSANAGVPYTLWLRLKATANSKFNDAVFVQFSDALAGGSPVYQINTTAGLTVNLATDAGASSLQNWGWINGAYWLSQPTTLTFASGGSHTLRIQVREDGVQLDQVVLSPGTYLSSAPGPVSNDSTIVPKP